MKVEQLKAELVVFKGLMSNVSAQAHPHTRPLRLTPRLPASRRSRPCQVWPVGFLSSTPSPTSLCFRPPLRRERRNKVPVLERQHTSFITGAGSAVS